MATAQIDDDDAFGTYLAYSPSTDSLARTFGYLPRLSPLASTPPHLRNISSAGVGLASIPPQQQQQQPRRVAPYKGMPPTGPMLSSTPSSTPQSLRRIMVSNASPPSIGAAGVGLFSPSPAPSPPQQLGFTPRRTTPTSPPLIGTARVGLSSPSLPTSSTPRRRPTVRRQRRRRTTTTPGTTRGSTTSSARSRVARIRHTPTTRRRVRSLQRSADRAVRGRRIAAVTETRTVTTTYKGNNHPPRVTRVSTRQTTP